jgi:hypothetical protein
MRGKHFFIELRRLRRATNRWCRHRDVPRALHSSLQKHHISPNILKHFYSFPIIEILGTFICFHHDPGKISKCRFIKLNGKKLKIILVLVSGAPSPL